MGTDIHRTPWRLRAVPAAVILIVGLTAGCAGERAPDEADAGAEPALNAADTIASGTATAPADEQQDEPGAVTGAVWTAAETNVERPVTGAALLRDLRTARHDGFDRVVLDFGADNVPGYRVTYVDRPVYQCGSGEAVPLEGDAWLSITVQPANAHTEAGEPTVRARERTPRLPVLLELKMICDFEAVVKVVAGVASPGRYRAFVLSSPGRLVVDIMHPGE